MQLTIDADTAQHIIEMAVDNAISTHSVTGAHKCLVMLEAMDRAGIRTPARLVADDLRRIVRAEHL
jgi:hypothetical protein